MTIKVTFKMGLPFSLKERFGEARHVSHQTLHTAKFLPQPAWAQKLSWRCHTTRPIDWH